MSCSWLVHGGTAPVKLTEIPTFPTVQRGCPSREVPAENVSLVSARRGICRLSPSKAGTVHEQAHLLDPVQFHVTMVSPKPVQ
jgi:hypothetical protein